MRLAIPDRPFPQEAVGQPYGAYPVGPNHRWLVRPTRWLRPAGAAKSLAHLLRRLFILTHRIVVDGEVDGFKLRTHLKGNVPERQYFFMPRLHDRVAYEFIRAKLKPGGCFVDIGANAGIYSLWASAAAGPKGRVLAIEPNPEMIERLRFNITANGFDDRVEVVPVAVGDSIGGGSLCLDATNPGGASLDRHDAESAIRVPVQPLLTILADRGIEAIEMMKLYIEGHEDAALLPFLRDAPDTLLPKAIIIEDSMSRLRVDLLALLDGARYRHHLRGRLNFVLVRT